MRLKLGLCHKVWFWSSPFHSSTCLSWRLFPPLFDPCYPDIPVFSLLLAVFQDLVSQALDRIIVFHASCSIFCFLWYDRSGLLIYVPDNCRFVLWNALPLLSTLYFHCRHHRISFLFCQDHYHLCSGQTSPRILPVTLFFPWRSVWSMAVQYWQCGCLRYESCSVTCIAVAHTVYRLSAEECSLSMSVHNHPAWNFRGIRYLVWWMPAVYESLLWSS